MTAIYSFESTCRESTELSLVRDAGANKARIVHIPDGSYVPRMKSENSTLVMPGGSVLKQSVMLQGQHEKIKALVAEGMNYLGICAGANLGCKVYSYKDGKLFRETSYRLTELGTFENGMCVDPKYMRLLGLSDIHGIGPDLANNPVMKKDDYPGKRVVIEYKGEKVSVYWNSSTFFMPSSTLTLATDGANPVIVSNRFGKGEVVLSGIHPEVNVDDLNKYYPEFWTKDSSESQKFVETNEKRVELMKDICRRVKIIS